MAKILATLALFWAWITSLRIGVPGVWLILLYLIFGSFVVLSLSAFQLQQQIAAFRTKEGAKLAIWEVLTRHSDWTSAKKEVDTASTKISNLTTDIVKKNLELSELRRNLFQSESDCKKKILIILEQYTPDNPTEKNTITETECFEGYFNGLIAKVKIPDGELKNSYKSDVSAARDAIQAFSSTMYNMAFLSSAIDDNNKELISARTDLQEKKQTALKVAGGDEDPAILDFLSSISYLQESERNSWVDALIPSFSEMPPDMLTLILVLSMGALGGTLSLTQVYFASRGLGSNVSADATASYYLFKPFLGAVTALCVFILSKAGVLVVTTSGVSGENASLSPFFLSFLGLISGLLAEQALTTIQGVGSRLFTASVDSDKLRWAYRLKEELGLTTGSFDAMTAEDKQKLEELSTVVGVQEQVVLDWLGEKDQVPLSSQKLISVYLRKSPRLIFSDIPAA